MCSTKVSDELQGSLYSNAHDVVEWCNTHFASDKVGTSSKQVDRYHIKSSGK